MWYNLGLRNRMRHGQAALEYVLALASLLVVVGTLWGLVVAAERHARRSEALSSEEGSSAKAAAEAISEDSVRNLGEGGR